jgi:hypothetical protein
MALDVNQDFRYCVFGMDAEIAVFHNHKIFAGCGSNQCFLTSKIKGLFLGQPLASGGCYFRNARA